MKNSAKVLSKQEQQKSIAGTKKNKKPLVKTALANPFENKSSSTNNLNVKSITTSLKESLQDLNFKEFSPPMSLSEELEDGTWGQFVKDYEEKAFQKAINEGRKIKYNLEERRKVRSTLVIGCNAVLRSIEKNLISCVIVNGSASAYMPVESIKFACSYKQIPCVPISDLQNITSPSDSLGIFSCSAIGLKTSCQSVENPFNGLYQLLSKAGKHEVPDISEQENKNSPTDEVIQKSSEILPVIDVSKYHWTRPTPNSRAFRISNPEVSSPTDVEDNTIESQTEDSMDCYEDPICIAGKRKYVPACCLQTMKNPCKKPCPMHSPILRK